MRNEKIIKISKKYNIPLIEDCAQAHGTKYHGKMVGSFGKIACFSFYATKHMTTGEGGIYAQTIKKFMIFVNLLEITGCQIEIRILD